MNTSAQLITDSTYPKTAQAVHGTKLHNSLRRIKMLSRFLDNAFEIPIIKKRIGWDGLIGLIPGIGDSVTLILSLGIILEGYRLGLPKRKLAYMAMVTGVDALVGAVPVLGDLFDVAFKANEKNVQVIVNHFEKKS